MSQRLARPAPTPYITAIRRLSLDDGPGLRTVVFFKGCPLACSWCHNPETGSPRPELRYDPTRCLACGACTDACPHGALGDGPEPTVGAGPPSRSPIQGQSGRHNACRLCGRCARACPSGALELVGRRYRSTELVRILLRDADYHQSSGGGVTFSGGEPTLAAGFLSTVLNGLHPHGVHVAIETAGAFAWQPFADLILPGIDLVYFDLKLLDPVAHRRHTGATNTRVLENFVRLCEQTQVEVVPRLPLVPGITDTPENLTAIEAFISGRRCRPLELLPYNPAGPAKRAQLLRRVRR